MINQYPAWKYALVGGVVLLAVIYALPNLFGNDPAIQVSPETGSPDSALVDRVQGILDDAQLAYDRVELDDGRLLVRFEDTETQLRAAEVVDDTLGGDFVVAPNLAPATPDWLRAINAQPMNLGLDLQGGVYFLMEIDMKTALDQAEERYVDGLRGFLREERLRYRSITRGAEGILIRFREAAVRDEALEKVRREFNELVVEVRESEQGPSLRAALSDETIETERDAALEQNITTLRNRVNELGVAEPVIAQQGEDRIVVQLPGVQDTARAKAILGATATLEFRLVHGSPQDWQEAAGGGRVPVAARLYERRDGSPILLKRQVIVTGDQITGAASGFDDQSGSPAVFVNLDARGAGRMSDITKENIGNLMAVVFIENEVDLVEGPDGERIPRTTRTEEVINVATIRDQLARRFQITGLDSSEEARDLALLLRAGALRAPIRIVEERTVGPSLGRENIEQGQMSVAIGLALVLAFMIVYYRVFGVVAAVAVFVNLVLVVAVLSLLQATLTLPGIAGIVLTVGMSVDANVLIFQRIREEIANGNSPQAAIHAGYGKALSTIADANVTTLIAAVVLYGLGTGPIKGFAVTLSIGIVTSMFTAILGTRAVVNLIYGGRKVKALAI